LKCAAAALAGVSLYLLSFLKGQENESKSELFKMAGVRAVSISGAMHVCDW
jgi:hypothetical protein